jgi:DNA (cytosine-5)-methyltransferase 1
MRSNVADGWQAECMTPTAIDLFSGAGGASLGLVRAGWDLRLAADFDQACSLTHQANLPGAFITGDLRDVDAAKVMTAADILLGELDLMFAGPPCQGFSIIGSRVVWDKRNNLFREVLRLVSEVQPRCVVIENVPGLVTLAGGAYLRAILQGLGEAGYNAACAELLAAQYGAPQMRWRLIIVGWRKDLGIPDCWQVGDRGPAAERDHPAMADGGVRHDRAGDRRPAGRRGRGRSD